MAWVSLNSNNTERTLSAFSRHDKDCSGALSHSYYIRHDESNTADETQPTSINKTDSYNNSYRDFNGNYEKN